MKFSEYSTKNQIVWKFAIYLNCDGICDESDSEFVTPPLNPRILPFDIELSVTRKSHEKQ